MRFLRCRCTDRVWHAQEYFFGELIPPYIDKLGRGAHLRPTDSDNTLYQSEAKCYRNLQALGSKVCLFTFLLNNSCMGHGVSCT